MTLENCERLLKHYKELADGTIEKPFGHKNWADVVYNAKIRATEMEKRIAHKLEGRTELTQALYGNLKKETKSKGKK